MEVIALHGAASVGKTTTLNIVYQLLLFQGYRQVPGRFQDLDNNDFLDVVEIDGVLVGIITQGDYVLALRKYLAYFQSLGCIKAVCACTAKPGTEREVRVYTHTFVPKTVSLLPDQIRIVNNVDATTVFRLV